MILDGHTLYRINTLVIGSGTAGMNVAIHFVEEGGSSDDILIATELLGGGTSFNAGSDKQTYYKLSLAGNQSDNIYKMAETYWNGGSMHGDIALIESANSVREFMHLVSLGVPFPTNKYGEYVGYKTDNDPLQRATSAGPLTSKLMAEALLKRVTQLGIQICNEVYCCKIFDLGLQKLVIGFQIDDLFQDISKNFMKIVNRNLVLFIVDNLIVATGGTSCIYRHSVYPKSQWGSLGVLIDYGCETQNLTESQFGIASTKVRWNLSGTYQQVLPTYRSYGEKETIRDAVEFLNPCFQTKSHLLNAIFLKGYQWPFNVERISDYGSSLIDLLIFKEITQKGRKVVLDYTTNPCNLSINQILELLDEEYANYLLKSKITADPLYSTPISRLRKINPKAYDLYLSRGIDLEREQLDISVCAQHSNGGISGDIWWESSRPRVFVIGEANGSHGIHRPGGAALNSGQVGGLRAALKILHEYYPQQKQEKFELDSQHILELVNGYCNLIAEIIHHKSNKIYPSHVLEIIQNRMAKYGFILRTDSNLKTEVGKIDHEIRTYFSRLSLQNPTWGEFIYSIRVYDALITHAAYLHSILTYIAEKGGSRGSYIIDQSGNRIPHNPTLDEYIVKIRWNLEENSRNFSSFLEKRKNIPQDEDWFETAWHVFDSGAVFKEE
ncbi:MAG: FAD-binding protein [Candidatus Lokiarchaeota archaeon]|nr:FAD-binding protein [Candidatus Lokiarchaeota archaeon]